MPTDKPSFYAPIFQISIQSDQKWLGYALLNFENYHFILGIIWRYVTWPKIRNWLCKLTNNIFLYLQFRFQYNPTKIGWDMHFWILKIDVFLGLVTSRDQNLEIDYGNLQAIFLCSYISNFSKIRPKMAEGRDMHFWILKFVVFGVLWRHMTKKLEIDNANLQFIFLCTYISNFNTFRPKMAEICIFEFWKLSFLGSGDVTRPKNYEKYYSNLQTIFLCT